MQQLLLHLLKKQLTSLISLLVKRNNKWVRIPFQGCATFLQTFFLSTVSTVSLVFLGICMVVSIGFAQDLWRPSGEIFTISSTSIPTPIGSVIHIEYTTPLKIKQRLLLQEVIEKNNHFPIHHNRTTFLFTAVGTY